MLRKDILGNIIGILDKNGTIIVKYKYDGWGRHKVLDASGNELTLDNCTATNKVGILNPFRYRGYYYDTETGLYYLQTRYYDPEVGRFITIDDVSYLAPDTINGLNLYAYCGNNPVMRTDSQGTSWWNPFSWDWKAIGRFIGGSLLTIGGAIGTVVTAPLALVPGLSIIPQVTFSVTLYGGFVAASAFSDDIYKDMSAIGWNPFNGNESAVIAANKVSFYKGVPVFRHSIPGFTSASAFGMIFLNRNDTRIDTVRHEWGHIVQAILLGQAGFLKWIAVPSLITNFVSRFNEDVLFFSLGKKCGFFWWSRSRKL